MAAARYTRAFMNETPLTLTRILHPSVLVERGRTRVLFDPCFGDFARRPFTARVTGIRMPAPGILPEAIGALTVIAMTHGHEDHFDAAALSRLTSRDARVVVPTQSQAKKVRRLGFRDVEVIAPWKTVAGEGWALTATPARAPNARVEISYVLDLGGRRILHAGDTASHRFFEEIAERCAPAAACLPVSGVTLLGLRLTMTPGEAARAACALAVKVAIPIHAEMRFERASSFFYRAEGSEESFEA